jgi:hypothetical protein
MTENTEEKEQETFVYDGREVVLTGRKAVKETRRSKKIIVEVQPLGIGRESKSFNKWVDPKDLFHIDNAPDAPETPEDNTTQK